MIQQQLEIPYELTQYGLTVEYDPDIEGLFIHYPKQCDIARQLITYSKGGYYHLFRTNFLWPIDHRYIQTQLQNYLPEPYNKFFYYLKERL